MSVPVNRLNDEQKIWYARFVIGAILADEEITPSEVDFMKQVISIVSSPEEKKKLMGLISAKKRPPLTPPEGIAKEILAAIFIELVLIMISDLDFAEQEKVYLKEVSDLFSFTGSYFNEVMQWGQEGLEWKQSQRYLIKKDGNIDNFQVPLSKLNSQQKGWYAKILIATIMLDGLVDETELQFLKAAMSFVDNKKDQQQLVGYVRNKMAPPITKPPNMPEVVLALIFFEVILIVSADEALSYKEQNHLKTIADTCGFSKDFLDKAINWCQEGIKWKQNKNPLISRCKFSKSAPKAQIQGGFDQHPENSSVLVRNFECFICEGREMVTAFQLKPHTQEPNRNIFGITTYLESMGNNDYVDYNLLRVFICPGCFFASTEKNLFRKGANDPVPNELNKPKLKSNWLKTIDKRRTIMQPHIAELSSIERSMPAVTAIYEMAIQTEEAIGEANKDQLHLWQAVALKLTLAEIYMSNGEEQKADEYLAQVETEADNLFRNAQNDLVAIRSARVLFFIGLYRDDVRMAGPYVDYLRNLHLEQSSRLKKNEQAVLKKIFGETQNALKNRSDYTKERLFGYHLNI